MAVNITKFTGKVYAVINDPNERTAYDMLRQLAALLEGNNVKFIDDICVDNCEGITTLSARTESYELPKV